MVVQEATAAHSETTTPDQDLASTITVASTITGHRKGPFPPLPMPLNHLIKSAGGSVAPLKPLEKAFYLPLILTGCIPSSTIVQGGLDGRFTKANPT